MIMIRHERAPVDGQPIENTFCAIDGTSGMVLGSSVIYTDLNPMLYPARPLQVRIQNEGSELPDKLIGATIARARQICSEAGEYARIFTRCAPDDYLTIKLFEPFGFEDNDGLICMRRQLPSETNVKLPSGCAVVYDDLKDSIERKYFLDRYNQLFNTEHDMNWLDQFIYRDQFMRILTVAATGIAGEILIWREENKGVIGYVQTSKRWRRFGVAAYMVQLACEALEQLGLQYVETNIRARYPHVLKLLTKSGFEQAELLMRYPGVDINPE